MEFEQFYLGKLGRERSEEYLKEIPSLDSSHRVGILHRKDLLKKYDYGLAIARGGLFSGYCFQEMGLPVKAVESQRTEEGASWNEIESLDEFSGKRILIFDQDVIHGKTIHRTFKELSRFSPSKLGIFINFPETSNIERIPFSMNLHSYDWDIEN